MGKFHRLNIEEAEKEFPLLNEEAKKNLKGGCMLHHFFGGAYSWEELAGKCVDNDSGKNNGLFWVCDVGLVKVDKNTVTAVESLSADKFGFCGLHPMNYYMISAGCQGCYEDKLGNYPLTLYTFCGSHQKYFETHAGCWYCDSDEFTLLYPEGCYSHGDTGSNCAQCYYESHGKYPGKNA